MPLFRRGRRPHRVQRFISAPFSVDLSDVAEGCTVPFPEVPESDSVFIPVVSQQGLSDYTMTVNLRPEAGADSSTRAGSISLTLVPGGVSYRNWRRLQELGMDPFTHRFLNPAANFFLTSRTGSWRIVVRETELYPLYFIMPDAGTVIIRERLSHKEYAMSLGKGVWALSITALRLHFLDQEHILASASMFTVNPKTAKPIPVASSLRKPPWPKTG